MGLQSSTLAAPVSHDINYVVTKFCYYYIALMQMLLESIKSTSLRRCFLEIYCDCYLISTDFYIDRHDCTRNFISAVMITISYLLLYASGLNKFGEILWKNMEWDCPNELCCNWWNNLCWLIWRRDVGQRRWKNNLIQAKVSRKPKQMRPNLNLVPKSAIKKVCRGRQTNLPLTSTTERD